MIINIRIFIKNDYVRQQYLPDVLLGRKYYHPKENKNEKNIKRYYG